MTERPAALREGVSLAERTTFGVGGPARFLVEARTVGEVQGALAFARTGGLPVVVLGGGSNVLVADRGLDAFVLRPTVGGTSIAAEGGRTIVRAGAGERWDTLVERTVAFGLAGVECLSGIPGDVGGAPIQNIGAYGQEVAETIVEVAAVDRASGEVVRFDRAACAFGYRDSAFKRALAERFVVVEVAFALTPGGAPSLRYAELARTLGGAERPSLASVRAAVIALRRSKSMVYDPADDNHRSAGSFFTNPTLDDGALAAFRARDGADGAPTFAADGGRTKLSAGWLIERAGFPRGSGRGRVGLSTKHALALVNRGGATAAELVAYAAEVRAAVRARFGVTLTPEPALLGFEPAEIAGLVGDG